MTRVLVRAGRRLSDERGIALVMALGILFVLSTALTSIVYFTSTNSRTSARDRSAQQAHTLAEAGVNNGLAVLHNATDLTDPTLLPPRTQEYEGGRVEWSGELVDTGASWEWRITSTGIVRNPTGPGAADVRRTLTGTARLSLPPEQPLTNPMWNWIYSGATGGVCDTTIDQSVTINAPLYVVGNLCMRSTAKIVSGPTVVEGSATLEQPHNAIGSQTAPISRVFVGNGCQYKTFPGYNPCKYNDPETNIWASDAWAENPKMRIGTVYWDYWYRYASPGPRSACATSSGTPPIFEYGDTLRNNSVPGVADLAPANASYTCKTSRGEISWNHVTKVLTVRGTVFIDGSAKIENGTISSYDAFSAVYLSGTLLIKNSTVCAVLKSDGTGCDQANWDPNTKMLIFAADGTGGQVPAGMSIQLVSSVFQGGLYGTGSVSSSTTTQTQGPQVSQKDVQIGQSNNLSFPPITIAPVGAPGNEVPPPTLEDPDIS